MPTLQQDAPTSRIAKPAAWRLELAPPPADRTPPAEAPREDEHAHLISHGLPQGLENVALGSVDGTARDRRDHCELHEHGVPELNVIVPITALSCEVVLGGERYDLEGPASIFVPAGLAHSVNVKAGTGFFVTIALAS